MGPKPGRSTPPPAHPRSRTSLHWPRRRRSIAGSTGDRPHLRRESRRAAGHGRRTRCCVGRSLPVQWREVDPGQPYPVSGAIWLRDQIGLQQSIASRPCPRVERTDGQIYESTRVLSVDAGSPCEVRTRHGLARAGQVVIAAHYPILDRGLFFGRPRGPAFILHRRRGPRQPPTAMAIDAGRPTRSMQFTGSTVIIGGEGRSTGAAGVSAERFQTLERFAGEHWTSPARWPAGPPRIRSPRPPRDDRPARPAVQALSVATGWRSGASPPQTSPPAS